MLLLLIGSNTEECWSSSLQLLLHLTLWAIHKLRSPLSAAYLCGKQQVSVVYSSVRACMHACVRAACVRVHVLLYTSLMSTVTFKETDVNVCYSVQQIHFLLSVDCTATSVRSPFTISPPHSSSPHYHEQCTMFTDGEYCHCCL